MPGRQFGYLVLERMGWGCTTKPRHTPWLPKRFPRCSDIHALLSEQWLCKVGLLLKVQTFLLLLFWAVTWQASSLL
eukprot:1981188-Amphidinium_carterae.1